MDFAANANAAAFRADGMAASTNAAERARWAISAINAAGFSMSAMRRSLPCEASRANAADSLRWRYYEGEA
ncbi:hypothetical protein HMP09_3027 [Sphingomonas sp. HMP9]|nr:hypothetical protein HMP09_3027 [Sphingomonas sp. HMP9]